MDRISQLPECIVHHILSFVNTSYSDPSADLLRMSVLSKNWFHLTASFPVLKFNIYTFTKGSHPSRESFFKYVEYTTSRFCLQNVIANTFNLITTLKEPAELDIVNRCLELVLNKGVRKLVIDITNLSDVQKYRLPNVLLSVSVLKSLTILGCELPSSLTVDVVKFKCLIRLTLVNVQIDDEAITYLTTSCPLLQDFKIDRCHGFKRFRVHGHQNLRKVRIYYHTPLERIDIDAPNLSNLNVGDRNGRGAPQMNLASCRKLTTVTYIGCPLPNSNGCNDFFSNFPFVKNLVLVTNGECKNLKLTSHSLRTLVLHSGCDLEDIEFTTPNLGLFIYCCKYSLWPIVNDEHLPLLTNSTHLKGNMQCYLGGRIDALWFQKLRLFLVKKNGLKVLNLHIHASRKFTELEELKTIELPPYELEHVELQLNTHEKSAAHIAFVDAVLWCCRPRSLTLRSSFSLTKDLVEFTKEKLLQQEDEGHTNIQIVPPSSSDAQKHLRDLKSLSMALPRVGITTSFIKEEVIQEEANSQRCMDMEIS